MTDQAPLSTLAMHVQSKGFVVLTYNADSDPDSRFEAWAYEGPLDFNSAAPVRFGLGADPIAALHALNHQLSELPDNQPG